MRRNCGVGLVLVSLFILTGGGLFWQYTQNDASKRANPMGRAKNYPLPTDLAPDAVDPTDPHHFASLTYGIHAFFWWDPPNRNHGLDTVNLMQFSHVRQSFAWTDVEPEYTETPTYHWAEADAMLTDIEAKGVQVLARIDHAPAWALRTDEDYDEPPFDMERLTAYCSALATRYRGRIDAYQIWNEPNLHREWAQQPPSPNGYVKLLSACAGAIRAADPYAIIVTAGLAPTGTRDLTAMPDEEYLWRLYESPQFSASFDVLGLHAPGYKFAPRIKPETVVEQGGLRWQCFRHVEHMRAIMVANGDAAKQIAITEMGWTIDPRPDSPYHWFAVTPEMQARYLADAYAYAAKHWRPWMGLMVTLYLPDTNWTTDDEQYYWAIGKAAPPPWLMDPRPAYAALVEMRKYSTDPAYDHPARDAQGNPLPDEE